MPIPSLIARVAAPILAAAMLAPPSGRPPIGPAQREKARIYDVRYEVTVNSAVPYQQDDPRAPRNPKQTSPYEFGGTFDLVDTPIVMPLLYQGTYSRVDPDSVVPELWLGAYPDENIKASFRIDTGLPYGMHMAVLPIAEFSGQVIRWNVRFSAMSYSSVVDDAGAAQLTWPREWPAEVADGLKPQLFIESDDELFDAFVAKVTQGNLRTVPPYLAAKDLVRACVLNINLSGSNLHRGRLGVLHGLIVNGAAYAAREGRGNQNDLVCICVAVLRAAGIPARPVIGIAEDDKTRKILATWGEFYLHGAGWIPFDPASLRRIGIQTRDVRDPWPDFGTMKDLNRRVPLAYHFIPPASVESPQNPAVWGWSPRGGRPANAEQRISIGLSSRGYAPPEAEGR